MVMKLNKLKCLTHDRIYGEHAETNKEASPSEAIQMWI